MVHVSRHKLSKTTLNELFNQLNSTLGSLNAKQSSLFLEDFLGTEEKILLAKRLAAIIMLNQGQSIYKVSGTLKISTSTAKGFKSRLDSSAYDRLLKVLARDKNKFLELIDTIDSILHLGGVLPHYGQTHRSEAFKRDQRPFD